MREIKKVLICGLGAIGSIYADAIDQFSHEDLKILVDKERFERYTKAPKIFNGKELRLNYILPEDNSFTADLIIISTKYDGFSEAVKNIKNFVADNTIIISLLNGVVTEEILANNYGWKNILHSYYIGSSSIRTENNIKYFGDGTIIFGVKNGNLTDSENIKILKNYFDKVGIKYKVSEDIWHSMWQKFMLNVSSNQLSAILRLNFGQMNNEKCRSILADIMKEVQTIAKAEGVANTENMIEEAFQSFSLMTPEGKTSMLQDVEAKRPTEVELFAKTVIKLGEKHSIPTPLNKMLADMIEIIETGNVKFP